MFRVRRKKPRLEEVVWRWASQSCLGRDTPCPCVGSRPKSGLEAHLGLVPSSARMGHCVSSHTRICFRLSWACEPLHEQSNDVGDFDR